MTVNSEALIQTLKKAFDNKLAVIKETAQNARRAGATEVRIYFNPKRKFYAVIDNGIGIDNFDSLLSVAQSGWEESIKKKETAYGLGFLSSLFIADDIYIASNGKQLRSPTNDILNFNPISFSDSTIKDRTVIVMYGDSLEPLYKANYDEIFAGFPINVYVNDVKLNRVHAKDSDLHFITNDHG